MEVLFGKLAGALLFLAAVVGIYGLEASNWFETSMKIFSMIMMSIQVYHISRELVKDIENYKLP